jgi:small nuclear ribonucleoprotein (snRNP)-like protein
MMSMSGATASEALDVASLPEQIDSSLRIEDTQGDSDAVQSLKSLFNQTMRVSTRDGRVFLGTFAGTDKQLNILLINTDEYRFLPLQHANPHGRFVGLVLVPWRLVMRVEAHAPHKVQEVDVDPGVGLRGIVETYEDADDGLYT